jgi:copper oxidase (laccase) domain-containing protein
VEVYQAGRERTPVYRGRCSAFGQEIRTPWYAEVRDAAVALLEAAGSKRGDLLVALGPAVGGPAYQVERSVSLQVATALRPGLADSTAAIQELIRSGGLLSDPDRDRDRLDIRAASVTQLGHAGVSLDRIAVCPLCTVSTPLLFHSWRRDRIKAVQWSAIVAQG